MPSYDHQSFCEKPTCIPSEFSPIVQGKLIKHVSRHQAFLVLQLSLSRAITSLPLFLGRKKKKIGLQNLLLD